MRAQARLLGLTIMILLSASLVAGERDSSSQTGREKGGISEGPPQWDPTSPTVVQRKASELRCRGGSLLLFGTTGRKWQAPNGQTATTLTLTFSRSPQPAGPDAHGLQPGTCAFLDRPLSPLEPPAVEFHQLEAYSTTVQNYLGDPVHYWSFFVFDTGRGYFEAISHQPWTRTTGAVQSTHKAIESDLMWFIVLIVCAFLLPACLWIPLVWISRRRTWAVQSPVSSLQSPVGNGAQFKPLPQQPVPLNPTKDLEQSIYYKIVRAVSWVRVIASSIVTLGGAGFLYSVLTRFGLPPKLVLIFVAMWLLGGIAQFVQWIYVTRSTPSLGPADGVVNPNELLEFEQRVYKTRRPIFWGNAIGGSISTLLFSGLISAALLYAVGGSACR